MLTAAKLALRSIEWLSSDLGAPFPERGGVTSAIVGSSPERRPRGGSTAGWRKRQSCSLSTATVMVVMLSPSMRFRAHICRFPMICVFARLIRRPSLRNCGQFRGQVGTTSCKPGGCRSVRLRSFGADGRASKRLPDMRMRSLSLSAAKGCRTTLPLGHLEEETGPSEAPSSSALTTTRAKQSSRHVVVAYNFARVSRTSRFDLRVQRGIGMVSTRPDPAKCRY